MSAWNSSEECESLERAWDRLKCRYVLTQTAVLESGSVLFRDALVAGRKIKDIVSALGMENGFGEWLVQLVRKIYSPWTDQGINSITNLLGTLTRYIWGTL